MYHLCLYCLFFIVFLHCFYFILSTYVAGQYSNTVGVTLLYCIVLYDVDTSCCDISVLTQWRIYIRRPRRGAPPFGSLQWALTDAKNLAPPCPGAESVLGLQYA
jgi:hypothetical protein